ncbi:hypothetical protein HUW63_36160 [Myxococcus sp. AM001]|nr:hypothetical protein [Myxococcus sp. AM001]
MYFELEVEIGQKYGVMEWPKVPDGVFGFQAGDLITVPVPEPVEFLVNNTGAHPPADSVTSFMPVFSDRLVDAFRHAGADNMQTFKAILRNPVTGETWDSYKVVNVLGMVACAELDKSTYKDPGGMGYEVKELVIDTDRANGALLFRLAESQGMLIVNNSVLDHMYDEDDDPRFDGVDFIPIKSARDV